MSFILADSQVLKLNVKKSLWNFPFRGIFFLDFL